MKRKLELFVLGFGTAAMFALILGFWGTWLVVALTSGALVLSLHKSREAIRNMSSE